MDECARVSTGPYVPLYVNLPLCISAAAGQQGWVSASECVCMCQALRSREPDGAAGPPLAVSPAHDPAASDHMGDLWGRGELSAPGAGSWGS